ncbi:hypothetical protein CRD17_01360 [Corynebacterium sp. LK30]|uniref:helix-turn-helix transcriptional regulator n=1 Tax=Corynebacterium sp. LK30 TaxID=2044577 RepID=UPI0016524D45|nr:helix-turn-helix domain-containing protein [Corynebacterium sp. LK30]MBC6805865.1 hypothetical protein [Corynebacterium sp. LK30]
MKKKYQDAITELAQRGIAFRYDVAGTPATLEKAIRDFTGDSAYIINGRTPAAQATALKNTPEGVTIFLRDFLPTLDAKMLHGYKAEPKPAGTIAVPEILSPPQVAEVLGCSINTLRNQRSRAMAGEPLDTPPWRTHNKRVFYLASDLKQWLEERPIYGV